MLHPRFPARRQGHAGVGWSETPGEEAPSPSRATSSLRSLESSALRLFKGWVPRLTLPPLFISCPSD